jgi:GT2 family glycosyltransferase
VLLSFMAGASIVRRTAYLQVGGYDERFFIGGEEETLAVKLARMGWQMRYVPEIVMHHHPSTVNAPRLRHFGLRNTLVNCWLHRRFGSALRYTALLLSDTPKNRDFVLGLGLTLRALPWIVRERRPMTRDLDQQYTVLDRRRFATRRRLLTFREDVIKDPASWGTGTG